MAAGDMGEVGVVGVNTGLQILVSNTHEGINWSTPLNMREGILGTASKLKLGS